MDQSESFCCVLRCNLAIVAHRVTLADQSTYDARVVGFDQDKDVAVLRVDAPKDKLRPIPIGISADLLVGQKVYAIGNPVSTDIRFTIRTVFSLFLVMICALGLIYKVL